MNHEASVGSHSTGAPVRIRLAMESGQLWRQYLIAAVANIALAATGYSIGWTSPVNLKLKDGNLTDTPLSAPITTYEESWIGSVFTLGAIVGSFIGAPPAARIGRKGTMLISAVPLIAGWIIIALATSVVHLYCSRVLWGIGTGMMFTVSPMYCAEIATNESRGALGSYLQIFAVLGLLIVYCIGPYISFSAIAYVGLAMLAVFVILFFFMPETPIYYVMKGDRESAAKSLMTIRGKSRSGVEAELDLMTTEMAASMSKTATLRDVFKGGNCKALYISCGLVFFQQFCGITAVLFYLTDIFVAAGSDLDSSVATIIVGIVQVGASCVTPFVVDRLGRRPLLMFSSCGTTIGLTFLGVFFLLDSQQHPIAASIGFVPISSLIVFVVSYSAGLGPIPWAVMGELFPIEVKSKAAPIATALCWVSCFFTTGYFGPISQAVGMYAAFWIFAVFCVAAFLFTLLVVPETKGKSFGEIENILSGKLM